MAATEATGNIGMEPLLSFENKDPVTPIFMTVLKRDSKKEIIVTFSGTQGEDELMEEVKHISPQDYDIHNIRGAKVFEFFYQHYLVDFRKELQSQLKAILQSEDHKGYRVVFTGHSLGGALTVHAASDMINSKIVDNNQVYIYTFGQPRVGNEEFNQGYLHKVTENYRVVHGNDPVAHLPPCVPDFHDGCVISGFLIPIFPYHASTEIFYEKDMSSFTTCDSKNGEDSTCSDKSFNKDIEDHLNYFDIHIGVYYQTRAGSEEIKGKIQNLLKS
mmetsp:Transcript_12141/g.13663  ORF Transcript_12141/g.13663 Transcript_12141/m.13663 type:complete len:273 (-) Transcript_12141:25-843(-)